MTTVDVARLREIAEVEFVDIVSDAFSSDLNELRILLRDGSFIDVWFSLKVADRYSYHWERRALDGTLYRHDNMPDRKWNSVATYPKHFHNGSEKNVMESQISDDPEEAIRQFLNFARTKL
jgi:hypothetical protein